MTSLAANGKAITITKIFTRETVIGIDIQAGKSIIWALLTNASDYPRWNSTVISIDGTITKGGKIKLRSTLDPQRVFKLSVIEFEVDNRLVWGGAMGKRICTLKFIGNGLTTFSMSEEIGGPLFPLFAKVIPSFDKSFEQFARDLKKESEIISNSK